MSDATGSVQVPANHQQDITGVTDVSGYRAPLESQGPFGLSRDTWAKLVLWFIPIIFASGALFFSFKNMDMRVEENSAAIKTVGDQQHEIKSEQKLQASKLDTIKEEQAKLNGKVEKVDGKLDDQKDDLAAIKAKLGVRGSSD